MREKKNECDSKQDKRIHTNKDSNAVRMMLGSGEGHFCLPGLREVVRDDEIGGIPSL